MKSGRKGILLVNLNDQWCEYGNTKLSRLNNKLKKISEYDAEQYELRVE